MAGSPKDNEERLRRIMNAWKDLGGGQIVWRHDGRTIRSDHRSLIHDASATR